MGKQEISIFPAYLPVDEFAKWLSLDLHGIFVIELDVLLVKNFLAQLRKLTTGLRHLNVSQNVCDIFNLPDFALVVLSRHNPFENFVLHTYG